MNQLEDFYEDFYRGKYPSLPKFEELPAHKKETLKKSIGFASYKLRKAVESFKIAAAKFTQTYNTKIK